jgi:Transposase IS116/IS110/IS902 family
MSRFPSAGHLASWAGLCPGNNESAGKRKSGRTRKGSKWLRATLSECAKAAARSRGTYLSAHCHRLRGRRGPGKATTAVAHSILVCAYHMLERGVPYQDLGDDYYVRRQAEHADRYRRRLVRQLERMGTTSRSSRYRPPPDPQAHPQSDTVEPHERDFQVSGIFRSGGLLSRVKPQGACSEDLHRRPRGRSGRHDDELGEWPVRVWP